MEGRVTATSASRLLVCIFMKDGQAFLATVETKLGSTRLACAEKPNEGPPRIKTEFRAECQEICLAILA